MLSLPGCQRTDQFEDGKEKTFAINDVLLHLGHISFLSNVRNFLLCEHTIFRLHVCKAMPLEL